MTARNLSLIFPYSLVVLLAIQCFYNLNLATLAPTMACMVVILCVAGLAAFRGIPENLFLTAAAVGSLAVCWPISSHVQRMGTYNRRQYRVHQGRQAPGSGQGACWTASTAWA